MLWTTASVTLFGREGNRWLRKWCATIYRTCSRRYGGVGDALVPVRLLVESSGLQPPDQVNMSRFACSLSGAFGVAIVFTIACATASGPASAASVSSTVQAAPPKLILFLV